MLQGFARALKVSLTIVEDKYSACSDISVLYQALWDSRNYVALAAEPRFGIAVAESWKLEMGITQYIIYSIFQNIRYNMWYESVFGPALCFVP